MGGLRPYHDPTRMCFLPCNNERPEPWKMLPDLSLRDLPSSRFSRKSQGYHGYIGRIHFLITFLYLPHRRTVKSMYWEYYGNTCELAERTATVTSVLTIYTSRHNTSEYRGNPSNCAAPLAACKAEERLREGEMEGDRGNDGRRRLSQ